MASFYLWGDVGHTRYFLIQEQSKVMESYWEAIWWTGLIQELTFAIC